MLLPLGTNLCTRGSAVIIPDLSVLVPTQVDILVSLKIGRFTNNRIRSTTNITAAAIFLFLRSVIWIEAGTFKLFLTITLYIYNNTFPQNKRANHLIAPVQKLYIRTYPKTLF